MTQQGFLDPVTAGSFDIVIRGYERSQVHDRLASLGRELRILQADRDASLARAEKLARDLAAVHVETESLRGNAQAAGEPSFQSMGARISDMLKLAEEEAADIRSVAQQEQSRSRADLEAAAQECARMRSEAQDEARRVVEQAQTQSRSRMAKEAEDLDLDLKSRRAEAARIERERDQASRHDAETRIEQARRESERMVADAQQRVAGLETQSVEVQTWLAQLREALATVPAVDLSANTSPFHPASQPPETPAPQGISRTTALDHREADSADPGDHPLVPEPEEARNDLSVLGREDILEYRHTRRRVR